MKNETEQTLALLVGIAHRFDHESASAKVRAIRRLDVCRFRSVRSLTSFHETLCFLRAYPDNQEVLETAEQSLERFADRPDVAAHGYELQNSGISGAPIHYRFYWQTARWLAERWPRSINVDWWALEDTSRFDDLLHLLVPHSESPYLDEYSMPFQEWIDELKGPDETDATFLIKRVESLHTDELTREAIWDGFDLQLEISPDRSTPCRGSEVAPGRRVTFQRGSLDRSRPRLRKALDQTPSRVRSVSPRVAARYLDLTRGAMVTRMRDLDSFANADINDTRLIDFEDGLQFVCFGAKPERRLLIECVYGFLTLKNGIPIGYVLASSLFNSSEIAYNVFDSFRGGEAAQVFGRVLSMSRHLFGASAFSIDTYQLGHGNKEGLNSGAWWFYYKLGFRPRDRNVRMILRRELAEIVKDPRHRSSNGTLKKLSSAKMYFSLDPRKSDILGRLSPGGVGKAISKLLSKRFGSDRDEGIRVCSREAAEALGVRSLSSLTQGERVAWDRWSPLVLLLDTEGWTREEKRSLVRVIKAKGGRRESDYVHRFDEHARLRTAIIDMMESSEQS